jgi:hypothetical protein
MDAGGRRTVERLARAVCPPEPAVDLSRLVDELEFYLRALSPTARRTVVVALRVVDQGARLYPAARGRRFGALDDETAVRCYHWMARPLPTTVTALLRGLVVMHFYALPEVEESLGYHPAGYVAAKARQRQERYADEIARAEQAVYADQPPP